jgi:methylthioribulose-1-phosphate dehydratase
MTVTTALAEQELAELLCQTGREFAAVGLVPATSGNLSARLAGSRILMTRSGVDKGSLQPADLLFAEADQDAPPGSSAEAPLHLALYRDLVEVGCILHVHSRAAAVISRLALGEGVVRLSGWELQKALAGQTTHAAEVLIPVFANGQDTVALAAHVSAQLAGLPPVPGYLLAGHGLYAWGRSVAEARRHIHALDALFQCELDLRSLR